MLARKEMGVTALVPGLPVQVQGSYNAQNQLVADTVKRHLKVQTSRPRKICRPV